MQKLNVEFIRTDTRGSLTQINTGEWKQLNYLIIKKGNSFGGHYHKHKKELFYLLEGKVKVIVSDNTIKEENLNPYELILIDPYDYHNIYAIEDSNIIELLSEPFDKDDVLVKK